VPEQLQQLRDELEDRTRELLEWQIHADVSAAANLHLLSRRVRSCFEAVRCSLYGCGQLACLCVW
jgi:hypothetical protein